MGRKKFDAEVCLYVNQTNSPIQVSAQIICTHPSLTQSKMNSTVDYTPVLLAQLTDLQMRVTKQDASIAALKAEVERLTGHSLAVPDTMRTSVPLRSHDSSDFRRQPQRGERVQRPVGGAGRAPERYSRDSERPPRDTDRNARPAGTAPRSRPKVANSVTSGDKPAHPSMSLADVLKENEEVSIHVHTGKDKDGEFIDAVATATFDGTDLTVTECEEAESLVGMKSSKPGEILYKFIDELKKSGVIQKTFTIAPWRLCFVERDGVRKSLEDLRNTVG